MLDEKNDLHKDRRAFGVMKENLVQLLTYAAHYEHLLTKAEATGRAFYDRHKKSLDEVKPRNFMKQTKLWSVGSLVEIRHLEQAGALPKRGLRPLHLVGSSDGASITGAK